MTFRYELSERAYKQYVDRVKDNEDSSFDLVKKKLNRNIILSKQAPKKHEDKMLFLYGSLEILVVGNVIVNVKNNKELGGRVNKRRKRMWNRILEIE